MVLNAANSKKTTIFDDDDLDDYRRRIVKSEPDVVQMKKPKNKKIKNGKIL